MAEISYEQMMKYTPLDDPLSYYLVGYSQLGKLCNADSGSPAFTSTSKDQYVLLGKVKNIKTDVYICSGLNLN